MGWIRVLLEQRFPVLLTAIGAVILFLAPFEIRDITKLQVEPYSKPAVPPLVAGSLLLAAALVLALTSHGRNPHAASDSTDVGSKAEGLRTVAWYTEWELGSNLYKETLRLESTGDGDVRGRR